MPPQQSGSLRALTIGPGARGDRLRALLGSAARACGDLLELFEAPDGRVLLDADLVPPEDAGLLRRWLARGQGELILFGSPLARRVWKELLREPRTRFVDWPVDVLDLEALLAGTHEVHEEPRHQAQDPQLAEVEAILGAPSREPSPPAPQADEAASLSSESFELEPAELAALAEEPELQAPLSTPPAPPDAHKTPQAEQPELVAPPAYFKDQVADLADIAQRIELSLDLVAEADERAALAPLEDEVRRLTQFTRTLGYLVAPPGPGSQNIDLSELVEIFLASAVSRAEDAPRCLFRGGGPLAVRSDRALLTQALDAFFFVAQACAESGEIVRVQTARSLLEGRPAGLVTIEFPAGKLSGVAPETILTPYGLRRLLPTLGPNALAAATGILAGQGGRALLERRGEGRLAWRIELPLFAPSARN